MYEIEDLDSSEQFVLLCPSCAYVIGADVGETLTDDKEISSQIASALKAGFAGWPSSKQYH